MEVERILTVGVDSYKFLHNSIYLMIYNNFGLLNGNGPVRLAVKGLSLVVSFWAGVAVPRTFHFPGRGMVLQTTETDRQTVCFWKELLFKCTFEEIQLQLQRKFLVHHQQDHQEQC
jgi:hypothetical protein